MYLFALNPYHKISPEIIMFMIKPMSSSSLLASSVHMAVWPSFKPFIFNFAFFFFLVISFLGPWIIVAEADDYRETPPTSPNFYNGGVSDVATPPLFTTPPISSENSNNRLIDSSFKPGIAVVVGVLTTIFSITFLLLLKPSLEL